MAGTLFDYEAGHIDARFTEVVIQRLLGTVSNRCFRGSKQSTAFLSNNDKDTETG